jgi:hypothetical protein
MAMSTYQIFRGLCLGLGILMNGLALAADDAKPPKAEKSETELPAIADALDELADVEFVEAPLTDVVEYLRTRHRIPILIDNAALREAEIASDTQLTLNLRNVSLRAALSCVLREPALDWTVQDEVVLITSRDVASATLSTIVYDVSDIVPAPVKDDKAKGDESLKTLERLVETIRTSVEPATWTDTGGPGTVAALEVGPARMLVVHQNRRGHEAVTYLLDDIAFCTEDARLEHDKRSSGAHAKITRWALPTRPGARVLVEAAH